MKNLHDNRGSLLIVAMIFAAILAIALTTYLKLATTALNLSQRSFLANDSMNVTEAGLEQGLWAFNQATSGNATAWTGWTITGNNATRTFSDFSFAEGATGKVNVYVQNYNSSGSPAPFLVAKGMVTPAQGGSSSIVKMVEVYLIRRSLFANGMVGRNGISFSGNNASIDSWNSNPTNAASGNYTPVAYSAGVQHDLGSIAAVNVSANVSVQNADIWGDASVGGNATTQIQVGSQGVVGPFGTPSGTKDPSHVASNFTDNLPNAVAPTAPALTPTIASISGNFTLPRTDAHGVITDTPAADGSYYYNVGNITESGNGDTLTISAGKNVVLLSTVASGSSAVSISGHNAGISLQSGGTLAVYAAGDIDIEGDGLLNANTQPSTCQIWGTNTTAGAQTVAIKGNGSLSSVVYAPNANITIVGNGDVMGAIVGYTDTVNGNAAFHYDESLANWGGTNPFQISKWRELVSSSDRATYASQLNF